MDLGGAAGPPDGPAAAAARADAHRLRHQPDPEALRVAEQMQRAGLKWRPAIMSPATWFVVGLIALTAVLSLLFLD